MRIAVILLFGIIFHAGATNIYSQTTLVSLNLKNVTVEKVLNTIEENSEFYFLYNSKLVNVDRKVNIDVKNQSIESVLKSLFGLTNVYYKIEGKQIILSNKTVSSLDAQKALQQNIKRITGIVRETNKEPITGANVSIKGTPNGTMTDVDGNFSLNVAHENILVISFIGYHTQEIPVRDRTTFDITLLEDNKILDEVVIVGYGTQKKVNLTGSVVSVSTDVLESRPISNLSQGLQGLIGNLNISMSSGAPGTGAGFNIRGTTSINSSGPLVLVDGVQMDPNMINPADVESVSVLKDAASASIYGTQAAYGVVLITTKKGKEGPAKVSFSANMAVNSPTRRPKYLDSWEFANFLNETHRNSGGGDYYDKNYMEHIYAYYTDPKHNLPVFIDPSNPNKYLYCGNTDWLDETVKKSTLQQQYTLSVSGKSEKTTYYGSAGFLDQGGTLKHYDDKYKRFNLNLNLFSDIRNWIQVRFKTMYNHAYKDSPYGANASSNYSDSEMMNYAFYGADLRPLMPVYHPDGNYSGQGSWTNMVATQAISGNRRHKENDIWLSGGIKLTPIKDMTINVDYTFNVYDITKKYHGKEIVEHTANPNITTIFPHTTPSSVEYTSDDNYYHTLRAFADYEKSFGKHGFKFLAGYDYEKKSYRWFNAKRLNLINNDLAGLGQAVGEKYNGSGERSNATLGYFARINYNYEDRYLLELNGRYDGSSRFPKDDRYVFFPSVSAAWRISNEKFFERAKNIVDELKIRGSYGSLGNQSVGGDYPYIPTMGTNSEMGYIIDGKQITSVDPAGLVSPYLTWESVRQIDFGLDWVLLNNRLYGSFDWYCRNTYDMVTNGTPLPAVLGTGVPKENTADLKTIGFELSIGWRDRPSKDLSYEINFILSDYQTEITKFNNPQKILSTHYVGKKWGEVWGFETEGLFQSQEEINAHADQSKIYGGTWHPGDVKYKDLDGDGEITKGQGTLDDPGDQKRIGNDQPRYSYGIKGGLKWRDFDFDIFFQGIGKRDVWTGGTQFWGFGNEWHVPLKHSLDSWREDNTQAYWPRSSYEKTNGNREKQTRYLQDASYLRLKSITLGYTLPKFILNKVGADNIRVYVTGQNLLTFTDMLKVFDPETVLTDLDKINDNKGVYPLTKSISFGLNVTF